MSAANENETSAVPGLTRRISRIRQVENEITCLLELIDRTPSLDSRLQLWGQVEERRFELKSLCGEDVRSPLLRRAETGKS